MLYILGTFNTYAPGGKLVGALGSIISMNCGCEFAPENVSCLKYIGLKVMSSIVELDFWAIVANYTVIGRLRLAFVTVIL